MYPQYTTTTLRRASVVLPVPLTSISSPPSRAPGSPLPAPRSADATILILSTNKPAHEKPVPGTQVVSKAKLVVALNARPDILLERFPHHVQDVLRCITRIKTESDEGMTLAEFSDNAGRVLRAPGGLATP